MASMAFMRTLAFLLNCVCVTIVARMPNCNWSGDKCQCHHSYTRFEDETMEYQKNCLKIFSQKKHRDLASQTCANELSTLVYKRLPDLISENFTRRGVGLIWIGVRQVLGTHIVESPGEHIFGLDERERFGLKFEPGDNFYMKKHCTALNIFSGNMVNVNCSIELEYVCQNFGFPVYPVSKSLACPKGWLFFYHLPFEKLPCIKPFIIPETNVNERNATATCLELGSQVADLQDFKDVYDHMSKLRITGLKDTEPFCETKYVSSVLGNRLKGNVTCLDEIFICARRARRIPLKPRISPDFTDSEESERMQQTFLHCDVSFKSRSFADIQHQLHYVWYKDEKPIANLNSRSLHVYSYTQPVDSPNFPPSRQGSYSCVVEIDGIPDRFSSQTVNYFHSDIITFVVIAPVDNATLGGEELVHYLLKVYNYLQKVTADVKEDFPWLIRKDHWSIKWNRGKLDSFLPLMNVYYWTTVYDEGKLYFEMTRRFKENPFNIAYLGLEPIAYCFEQAVPSSSSTTDVSFLWKGTTQTKSAVSEPLCLNDWRLITRECRPSILFGARWGRFDASKCTKYQNPVKELQTRCPEGFEYYDQNLCYSIHMEKKTFDEAQDICKSQSGFLADENSLHMEWRLITRKCLPNGVWDATFGYFDVSHCLQQHIPVLEKNALYWQSNWKDLKNQAKEEWFDKNGTLKRTNRTLFCLSEEKRSNYLLPPKKCDPTENHPFVCMHQPFLVLSCIILSKHWYRFSDKRASYYVEYTGKNWLEANKSCHDLHGNSTLLQGIRNLEEYSEFKVLLRQISDYQYDRYQLPWKMKNREFSWWMNLFQSGDSLKWLTSPANSPSYVDWERHTDFNMNQSAGVLTTHFGHYPLPLQWSLRHLSSKQGFICETQDLEFSHDTAVYIEERPSKQKDESNGVFETDLQCVPSGWFVWNSFTWFKDGVAIYAEGSQQRLHLTLKAHHRMENVSEFQGYYYCSVAVDNSHTQIFSSKLLVKIPDVHTFVLNLKSNLPEQSHCSDLISLELPFIEEFNKYLDMLYGNGSRLFLKKVNCSDSVMSTYHHIYIFKNMGEEKELQKSLENNVDSRYGSLFESLKRLNIRKEDLNIRSTVSCTKEVSCYNGHCLTWPETPIGESTLPHEMCITEDGRALERKCLGDFYMGAYWSSVEEDCADSGSKVTAILHELFKTNITDDNILNSIRRMERVTTTSDDLSHSDVQYDAEILRKVSMVSSVETNVLRSSIYTVNKVIDEISTSENMYTSTEVNRKISSATEAIALNTQTNNQVVKVAGNNIAMCVLPSSITARGAILENWSSNLTVLLNDTEKGFDEELSRLQNFEVAVLLPENIFMERLISNETNTAIIIRRSYQFLKNVKVISPVVDVVMGTERVFDVDTPVEFIFKISEIIPKNSKAGWGCATWDETLNENTGGFSYKGCLTIFIDYTHVRCYCSHLTSVAVVLEGSEGIERPKADSEVITIVVCLLLIVGILLLIFAILRRRQWRGSSPVHPKDSLSLPVISNTEL